MEGADKARDRMHADKERARRASVVQEKEAAVAKRRAAIAKKGARKLPSPTLQQAGANSLGGESKKSETTNTTSGLGPRGSRRKGDANGSSTKSQTNSTTANSKSSRNKRNPVSNSRMNELSMGLEELSLDRIEGTPNPFITEMIRNFRLIAGVR
jgi:hypothetical protein